MFFECRAMFLALQGKNGLSEGIRGRSEPAPERVGAPQRLAEARREPRRNRKKAASRPLFFLRSLREPLTWSSRFFREIHYKRGGNESEWAGNR
jgi:hypothetical protein